MGSTAITRAIQASNGPAVCAYLTAGFPTLDDFLPSLRSVAGAADVVEVGVPFTDPMADGLTIQQASHTALENGVTLEWILGALASSGAADDAPILLMGYYNPFLAFGLDRLGQALVTSGVSGLIIPDLPVDESMEIVEALEPFDIGLVQLVTPTTPEGRLGRLVAASKGFVYAVSTSGVTGGETIIDPETTVYLDRVKDASALPVLAGFGIKSRAQVEALGDHVDGVVVGSALIQALNKGDDPGEFVASLRVETVGT